MGADEYVLNCIADSRIGAGKRDVITSFEQFKPMDLAPIDADGSSGFIGNGSFSRLAGTALP
ncbi:MAG: hypothetical protein AAF415_19190 [Pseudomonadota bacterium]